MFFPSLSCFPFCRKWYSHDPNQAALSLLIHPPGPGRGMGPTNQHQQMFMPHCWEPPSLFSTKFQIPQVTDVRGLGVPLDTTFA